MGLVRMDDRVEPQRSAESFPTISGPRGGGPPEQGEIPGPWPFTRSRPVVPCPNQGKAASHSG